MKKTLIALAALAATGAFAQSSVSLYGRLDAGYATQVNQTVLTSTTLDQRINGVTSHNSVSSYWGLTGTEDLGGGLKASFKLEADVFPTTGRVGTSGADAGAGYNVSGLSGTTSSTTAGAFNRTSLLSLGGNFGTVSFGRDYVPTFSLAAATDNFGQAYLTTVGLSAGTSAFVQTSNTGATANAAAVGSSNDRLVWYTSPSLSGVVVKLAYGNSDTTDNNLAATASKDSVRKTANGSVTYTNGPLMVGFAMGNAESTTTASTNAQTVKDETTMLAGTYDFGAAKLFANYITAKYTNVASQSVLQSETNLGVDVPFGALVVKAQIGRNTYSSDIAGLAADRSGNDYALGLDYNLSKRTTAFARTGVTNVMTGKVNELTNDQKRMVTSIGLRHTF